MNWDWATAQLYEGRQVVRESERRREVEDLNGQYIRWIGREGIKAQAGFDINCQPCFMLVGTHSHVPIECNADDLAATDWVLE